MYHSQKEKLAKCALEATLKLSVKDLRINEKLIQILQELYMIQFKRNGNISNKN
jgi:hypothetical protein